MQKLIAFVVLFSCSIYCYSQQSDFNSISFEKADRIAKLTKSRRLFELNKLTLTLTENLNTDIEKARAIFKWICLNVGNDFRLYAKNERKRKKFKNDSLKLAEWNSELKRELFNKLLKQKRTICTGYAYLFKEMCTIADLECKMVYGWGKTVDFYKLDPNYPNHTWNAIKIDNKWYLCDATWAAGISYPEQGKFVFKYNDGYFLTEPELFFMNHYPVESSYSLLAKTPTFDEFINGPLVYHDAFKIFAKHELPKKMYHEIKQNTSISFQYTLKESIDTSKLKMIASTGATDKKLDPKIVLNDNSLNITYKFSKIGYYDIHLYFKENLIATYVVKVLQ